jgi:hypothetical protein
MKSLLLVFLLLGLIFSGCEATQAPSGPTALVRGSGQFSYSSSCSLIKIDGRVLSRSAESKRITPGKHLLTVRAAHEPEFAIGDLEVNLQAGKEYTLTSSGTGTRLLVTFTDTTEKNRPVIIKTTELASSGTYQRANLIFIPVVR